MAVITIDGLEGRARQILQRDGRAVKQLVRVELALGSDPGCILYVGQGGSAMTAWVWTHPERVKPTVIVEHGFQAEPGRYPDWL